MVEVSSRIPNCTRIRVNPVVSIDPGRRTSTFSGSQIRPLLQTLVPQPISLPPTNVLLLIKPAPLQPAAPAAVEPSCNPLDLSCKSRNNSNDNKSQVVENLQPLQPLPPPHLLPLPPVIKLEPQQNIDEPYTIRRANSCSVGSGLFSDEERRMKRKEQNKAAAQSYRQRKKSFSGLIETEFEKLTKRNLQLKAQKQKLEDQILKIRGLLNEVVEDSKRAEEAISDTVSEPPTIQSPSWSMDGSSFGGEDQSQMRSRKNTWPMSITGKDRKKEQNKLASRRFRQRRKQEMSHCEQEAQILENTNKRMREKCDELEGKIKLLKELMNKNNAMLSQHLLPMGEGRLVLKSL